MLTIPRPKETFDAAVAVDPLRNIARKYSHLFSKINRWAYISLPSDLIENLTSAKLESPDLLKFSTSAKIKITCIQNRKIYENIQMYDLPTRLPRSRAKTHGGVSIKKFSVFTSSLSGMDEIPKRRLPFSQRIRSLG
jgi:hypothetical protein